MVALEIRVNKLSDKSSYLLDMYFLQYLPFSHIFALEDLSTHFVDFSYSEVSEVWSLKQTV